MELLAFLALAAAIIAWVIAARAMARVDALEAHQREVTTRLLESQTQMKGRIRELECLKGTSAAVPVTAPTQRGEQASAATNPGRITPAVEVPVSAVPLPSPAPSRDRQPEPPHLPPPLPIGARAVAQSRDDTPPRQVTPPPPQPSINLEQFLGAKLFAWLGGLALFLGVVFFVKYAFEHQLISEGMRVAIGFATGIALAVTGLKLHRSERYRVLAQSLSATGVLVLYGVTYAAHALYRLPGFANAGTTFAIMAAITIAAFLMAVGMGAQVVAVLGMLGGFLSPWLCSTGQDQPFALFSYIALLDIGVVAVARRKDWLHLAPLAAAGTAVMQLGWAKEFYDSGHYGRGANTWIVIAVFAGFAWLFAAMARWCEGHAMNANAVAHAAIGLCASAMIAAFALLADADVATRPWVLYTLVLLINAAAGWLAWRHARFATLGLLSAGFTFLHLGAWTLSRLTDEMLPHALALYLLFGIGHTTLAVMLSRKHGSTSGTSLLPIAALMLTMLAIQMLPTVAFVIWPALLLVNLLVIAAAMLTRQPAAVIIALVCIVGSMALWLMKPAGVCHLGPFLIVLGVFTIFFVAGSLWLTQRLPAAREDPVLALMPALSAVLPYLLLAMAVLRLNVPSPTLVFAFTLALSLFLLEFSRRTEENGLSLITVICSLLVQVMWHATHYQAGQPFPALAWHGGFLAVFAAYPVIHDRALANRTLPWIGSAVACLGTFGLMHHAIRHAWPAVPPGLIPALFALVPAGVLVFVVKHHAKDNAARLSQLAWLGGTTLFFVTIIFPLQFHRQWITISWALEGTALLWLFRRVPHEGLRLTSLGLLLTAFARLALNPAVLSYQDRSGAVVWNWFLYAYGVTAAAMFVSAAFSKGQDRALAGLSLPALFNALGGVLLFLLVNIEIADAFTRAGERFITFQFSGDFGRDMTYTIAWSLFALGLLLLGFRFASRATRVAGIGLMGITLLKLFLHDLASVAGIYRIGALMVVALIAFAASYLYQRFAEQTRS